MPEDATQRQVAIFLSYRRSDTQWAARGIYDRLTGRYGHENVFRDLDAIPPGVRFRDYVERKISESDVLILLIGKAWASFGDETSRGRLEEPRDPVRLEIETALRLGVPIIPVKVEGALMPTELDLVPSIVDVLEFNAAEVTDSRWDDDLDRLLWAIEETVEDRPGPSLNSAGDLEAEEQAAPHVEEQARRDTKEQAGPDVEDAEHQARADPEVGGEGALSAGSTPPEELEWVESRYSGTARVLSRRRVKVVAAILAVAGLVGLISYLISVSPPEPPIMSHLPVGVRASCTFTDDGAICQKDGNVVFYRLFDTVTEAKVDLTGGRQIEPEGYRCPPTAPPPISTTVLCQYASGADKGLAMFSYITKDNQSYFVLHWVADTEPLLGEISTKTANQDDWTTLINTWIKLAKAK